MHSTTTSGSAPAAKVLRALRAVDTGQALNVEAYAELGYALRQTINPQQFMHALDAFRAYNAAVATREAMKADPVAHAGPTALERFILAREAVENAQDALEFAVMELLNGAPISTGGGDAA